MSPAPAQVVLDLVADLDLLRPMLLRTARACVAEEGGRPSSIPEPETTAEALLMQEGELRALVQEWKALVLEYLLRRDLARRARREVEVAEVRSRLARLRTLRAAGLEDPARLKTAFSVIRYLPTDLAALELPGSGGGSALEGAEVEEVEHHRRALARAARGPAYRRHLQLALLERSSPISGQNQIGSAVRAELLTTMLVPEVLVRSSRPTTVPAELEVAPGLLRVPLASLDELRRVRVGAAGGTVEDAVVIDGLSDDELETLLVLAVDGSRTLGDARDAARALEA